MANLVNTTAINLNVTYSNIMPSGAIIMWTTNTVPDAGWLICNGASIDRVGTYAALFGIIGTTYGSVDGDHFNIPDLRQKFPIGVGGALSLSNTSGSVNHTHTIAAHSHTMNNHTHTMNSHTHTMSSHTHTLSAHTHTMSSHTHTMSDHTHTMSHTHNATSSACASYYITYNWFPNGSASDPTHTHAIQLTSAANRATSTNNNATAVNNSATAGPSSDVAPANNDATAGPNANISGSNNNATANDAGETSSNNNAPYLVVNYIIKV